MPLWGNTDAITDKPKFDFERQVRVVASGLVTANVTTSGNTTLVFAGANSVNLAGIAVNSYIYLSSVQNAPNNALGGNVSTYGVKDFFFANNKVATIPAFATGNGNTVILASAVTGNVAANLAFDFANAIAWETGEGEGETTNYNPDTILITPTRIQNANTSQANTGNFSVGWNYIWKKTNSDGTVRWIKECLVALSSPVAANTNSGNTSQGQIVSGV